MRKVLNVVFLLLFFFKIDSQEPVNQVKFRGGMMCHGGYLKNARDNDQVKGICLGIGGQLSYNLGNHFRVGAEGYTSGFNYPHQDGYYKLGWGGFLFGYQFTNTKINPVFNITVGGGKVKDMFFIEGNTRDSEIDRVIFRKYPVILLSPSWVTEFSLKSNMTFIFKLDYLIPLFSKNYIDYAYGLRLFLGILFNRD